MLAGADLVLQVGVKAKDEGSQLAAQRLGDTLSRLAPELPPSAACHGPAVCLSLAAGHYV